jgi:hypothetical protein
MSGWVPRKDETIYCSRAVGKKGLKSQRFKLANRREKLTSHYGPIDWKDQKSD